MRVIDKMNLESVNIMPNGEVSIGYTVEQSHDEPPISDEAPTPIRPLSDRVIIIPDTPPNRIGLIIIPDTAKEIPARGLVAFVGPECDTLQPGDTVLYGKYAGTEIEIDGVKALIMRESDVLVILNRVTVPEKEMTFGEKCVSYLPKKGEKLQRIKNIFSSMIDEMGGNPDNIIDFNFKIRSMISIAISIWD